MSKNEYDFSDLEAILAEFSDKGPKLDETEYTEASYEPVPEAEPADARDDEALDGVPEDIPEDAPAPEAEVEAEAETAAPVPEPARQKPWRAGTLPPLYARDEQAAIDAPLSRGEKRAQARLRAEKARLDKRAEKVRRAREDRRFESAPAAPAPYTEPVHRAIPLALRLLLALIFLALSLAALCWTLFNVHPASGTLSFSGGDSRLRLAETLDARMNNAAADALGDQAYIRKIYTLQESDTVCPAPDPDGFGVTTDLAEVEALIQRAAFLLEGQELCFDPGAEFVPGCVFRYYLDDTIFVLSWQEYIERRCCTFAEVKIAHGSQLRRKLAQDSYSSSVQLYASDMANAANAVVAINGDFYAFRDLGITVYQRKLYRNNPAQVDSCFFTADGDMLFSRKGELMGEGEAQRFIEDNDVVFAVAFGPILVDNGEIEECTSYPIGEINTQYSRSCIAMKDKLHYLLMNINWDGDRPRATIPELGRYVYSKGVDKSYTLDGGQTSEIVMMGGPINHVDFNSERSVSDIIYFATAIPEEVRP